MKYLMQKAVERGLANGVLERPKASAESTGLTGRFKVQKTGKVVILKKPSKGAKRKDVAKTDEKENIEEVNKTKPKSGNKKTTKKVAKKMDGEKSGSNEKKSKPKQLQSKDPNAVPPSKPGPKKATVDDDEPEAEIIATKSKPKPKSKQVEKPKAAPKDKAISKPEQKLDIKESEQPKNTRGSRKQTAASTKK